MAENTRVQVEQETVTHTTTTHEPTTRTRLVLEQPRRGVQWTSDTVDNEHMNKKKSKCCCQFTPQRPPGYISSEESDSSDGECDHCSGHRSSKDFRSGPQRGKAPTDQASSERAKCSGAPSN